MKTFLGYDRVTIWLDVADFPLDKSILRPHCRNAKVICAQMPFNPTWKIKLDLFQPSLRCLKVLAKALGCTTAAMIYYVEIAQDLLAENGSSPSEWMTDFMAVTRMRYQRQEVVTSKEGTQYFGRRGDSNRLVVYGDRPSKLNAAASEKNRNPCLHIEWRVRGSDALCRIGIASIEDLIQFDHHSFWDSHLQFYRLPSFTELGRILMRAVEAREDVSTTSLRKRAKKWIASHSGSDGEFILHNGLLGQPQIVRQLDRITLCAWKLGLKTTNPETPDFPAI